MHISSIEEIFKTLRNIMGGIRNGERVESWKEKLSIIKNGSISKFNFCTRLQLSETKEWVEDKDNPCCVWQHSQKTRCGGQRGKQLEGPKIRESTARLSAHRTGQYEKGRWKGCFDSVELGMGMGGHGRCMWGTKEGSWEAVERRRYYWLLKEREIWGLEFFSVKYEAVEDEGVNRMWLCQ